MPPPPEIAVDRSIVESEIGRTSVGIVPSEPKPSDVSAEQRASNDLIPLIRKLRWMGMDDEAKRMQTELMQRAVPAEDSVLARPRDTD
jgi:hypothetical protein